MTLEELQAYAADNEVVEKKKKSILGRAKDKFDSAKEDSGYDAKDDNAEQKDLIEEYAENLKCDPINSDISFFKIPSIALEDFPNISMPFKLDTPFELPSFNLGEFPGIDLTGITLENIGSFKLPSIDLNEFPNIVFPRGGMGNITLPEIKLGDWFKIVQFGKLGSIRVPTMNIPTMNIPTMNIPKINIPKINIGEISKMKLNIGGK